MINWAQIKQLEEDVGSEDLAEVVTLFLMEVDEAVEALDLVSKGSAREIAEALHFLKGSAFNLGFQRFGDCCSTEESNAHAGNLSKISLSEVVDVYSASKAQFFAELQDHSSVRL